MSPNFLTGLGLFIVLFSVLVMLKLIFASRHPAALTRLLLCAWPLAALVGMGGPMVVLPMGPDVSVNGLVLVYAEILGVVVGSTLIGLAGVFITPQNQSKGAGLGLAVVAALLFISGIPLLDGYGGAPKLALIMTMISGGIFFFRPTKQNRQEIS